MQPIFVHELPEAARPDALEHFLERWGGAIMAFLAHGAALALLGNFIIPVPAAPPKPPPMIHFSLAPSADLEPPAQSAFMEPSAQTPSFEPSAATIADSAAPAPDPADEMAPSIPPDAGESTKPAQEPSPPAASLETAEGASPILPFLPPPLPAAQAPDPSAQLASAQARQAINEEMHRLEHQKVQQHYQAQTVRAQAAKLQVDIQARRWILNSDGGKEGAVRTLVTAGFPDDVVNRVFAKYHIQIRRNVMAPTGQAASFLNAAVTKDGTYQNIASRGPQDVFVLSPLAIANLSRLETEAIQLRGLSPRTTRVREIRFGIIKNSKGEFDLGVLDLVSEPIE